MNMTNMFYGIICFLLLGAVTAEDDFFDCPIKFGVFPHERYCDKFWECDNYNAKLLLCGNGLAFPGDDETYSNKECNWRHLVHCGGRELFQDPVGYRGCPLLYGLWPHEKFCNGFKRCWAGWETLQFCDDLNKVVHPIKMSCVDASKVPECNRKDGKWIREPYECPQKEGLFPHHLFCDRYWECEDWISKPHFCSNGLVYNPLHKKEGTEPCVMPRDVDCTARGLMAEPIPSGDARCPWLNGYFPHERKCNVYWECRNGKPIRVHCNKKLSVYNPRLKMCDRPDQVPECRTSSMTWETFNCLSENGYFAHKRSCDKYWKCLHGKSKLHTCPNGKIFDPFYSATYSQPENNYSYNLNDYNLTTIPKIESTTSTFINESTTNIRLSSTENISNLDFNISDQQTLEQSENKSTSPFQMRRTTDPCVNYGFADCGNRKILEPPISTPHCPRLNGIFIHKKNPNKYYRCHDGLAIEMKCPKENIFNPHEKACQKIIPLPPRPGTGCKMATSKKSSVNTHVQLKAVGLDCFAG